MYFILAVTLGLVFDKQKVQQCTKDDMDPGGPLTAASVLRIVCLHSFPGGNGKLLQEALPQLTAFVDSQERTEGIICYRLPVWDVL